MSGAWFGFVLTRRRPAPMPCRHDGQMFGRRAALVIGRIVLEQWSWGRSDDREEGLRYANMTNRDYARRIESKLPIYYLKIIVF